MFTKINIEEYYNNRGITDNSEKNIGNLTFGGSSLPKKELINTKYKGYNVFSRNLLDNIECEGQDINLNKIYSAKRIHIIGTSIFGDYYDSLFLKIDEETIEKVTVHFSDITRDEPVFPNNKCLVYVDYLHNKSNGILEQKSSIWIELISFDKGLQFNKIILPDNPCIHIFAIFLEGE